MKKMLMDYIREESDCNYFDLMDYFSDLNQCGHELKAKYLGDLLIHIACKEIEEESRLNKIVLENQGLGSLKQISDLLYSEMKKEINRNGYSDLTLHLEGASHGLREIIELNDVAEKQVPLSK